MAHATTPSTPPTPHHRRLPRVLIVLTLVSAVGAAATFPWWGNWLMPDRTPDGEPLPPATADEGRLPASMGRSWKQIDDPARDGWETEVFNDRAGKVLNQLGKLLTGPDPIDAERLAPLLAADFSCQPLRPEGTRPLFQDPVLHIERALPADSDPSSPGAHRGPEGLAEAFRELAGPFRGGSDTHYKFKLFRVTPSGDTITTRQYFALSGHTPKGLAELNATWEARWRPGEGDENPKLVWIGLLDFEQAVTPRKGPLFVDCTRAALGDNPSYREQFLVGMNHWFQRIQDTRYFSPFGHPGLALGDVNGDGLDDLYVCQESGLPNRLFLQQADGTARDAAEEWGVNWLESSRGALLLDLDNDGDQDLVVAMVGGLAVASNEGGRFVFRTLLPTGDDTMSLSAADFDQDGDLDLYACVYFSDDTLEPRPRRLLAGINPGERNDGGRNVLFRNDGSGGNWRFTDVTAEVGLDAHNNRYSFASAWEDYDNDGDQDLYIANDYGGNNLYRNDGGKFTDVADTLGALDSAFGMGVTWGDYDQDGRMDLYVSNMFSAAGGRITYQDRFLAGQPDLRQMYQRFARGNTLMHNEGKGAFADVSVQAGVTVGRWAWGSHFIDLNNDSLEDLVVANGFLTTEDTGDL